MNGNREPEHRIRRGRFSLASSGLLTALILAGALGIVGVVWSAHLRGRLHQLSTTEVPPDTSVIPRPGGQDLMDLHRITPGGGVAPQFTGITLLPGVGMGILQLTLDQPGREPVGILVGTPMEKLGTVLAPNTGLPLETLQFTPFSLKLLPPNGAGEARELLGTHAATQSRTDILPGGTGATATFASVPPPGPDGVVPAALPLETSVSSTISNRGLEVSIAARNVSQQPQRVVASWAPRIKVPAGGADKLALTPPETSEPLAGARGSAGRIPLSANGFHHLWTGLKHTYLSAGPELQLHNAADGYTLRITALTPSIRSVQVDSEAGSGFTSFRFSTAAAPDGPAGQETVIAPGESLEWRVRVQVTANQSYVPPAN